MPTLHFKGKTFVQNHHLAVKYHQLVPKKELSLTDKVSLHDNLIIQGDNLKALKALLPTYAGKIKCIYIDPPYNTGQENEKWVYNDNVNSPMIKEWFGKVVDKEDMTRHDKWLCMMMPRLKCLKELLANEGVIFISIDENEEHHLRNLCDEIFGAENFIEKIVWNKRIPKNDKGIGNIHEYILIYVKDSTLRHEFYMPKDGIDDVYDFVANLKKKKVPIDEAESQLKKFYSKKGYDRGITLYCNLDEQYRIWGKINVSWPNAKDGPRYDVLHPKTKKPTRVPDNGWRYKEDTMKGYLDYKNVIKRHDGTFVCGRIWFAEDERTQPSFIQYLDNVKNFLFRSIISLKSSGGSELDDILPEHGFPHPKTYKLLRKLIQTIEGDDFIVLDSFAGSGTTAHAVLDLNFEHNTKLKFILVETEDYANEITAERVRRVIKGVPKSTNFKEGLGGSFSYFELGNEIEMESILRGKNMPSFKEFARYLFYTATGEEFNEKIVNEKTGFIGQSQNYEVYLHYKPDTDWLKKNALTLEEVKALPKFKSKQRLVFAPAKYVDDYTLREHRVDYCQLPYEIYRIQK
ncbi:MAG: site-specific DNA-methyltransferase [Sediminibacterium sp.]|nr:site-specific DNA-methyltransferase [Sediminibacterium sp.]